METPDQNSDFQGDHILQKNVITFSILQKKQNKESIQGRPMGYAEDKIHICCQPWSHRATQR